MAGSTFSWCGHRDFFLEQCSDNVLVGTMPLLYVLVVECLGRYYCFSADNFDKCVSTDRQALIGGSLQHSTNHSAVQN